MRYFLSLVLVVCLLQGCMSPGQSSPAGTDSASRQPAQPETPPAETPKETPADETPPASTDGDVKKSDGQYENDIFQAVTVKKGKDDTYDVTGKAKVFEGNFSYVVEDGHNELTKGSVQSSAGAPDWGDFAFTVKVKKASENSTLTLILFEVSAKDGSRRLELPIPLPDK